MSIEKAKILLANGEGHALAAALLFTASHGYARDIGVPDDEVANFAFNGVCSLSVHYLVGLGLELMLKAAYIAYGGNASDNHLRQKIGHDLKLALAKAQQFGFETQSENLVELVGYMNKPYKEHYLRYSRPHGLMLPDDMKQVATVFETLRNEVGERINTGPF
jgi:hypothetical protein